MIAAIAAPLMVAAAAAPAASAQGCPDEATVRDAIQRLVMVEHFRPQWVRAIDRFDFGPITFGQPFEAPLPDSERDGVLCPVFLAYSFTIAYQSGEERRVRGGRNIIHGFFRNALDEWTLRAIRGADQLQ